MRMIHATCLQHDPSEGVHVALRAQVRSHVTFVIEYQVFGCHVLRRASGIGRQQCLTHSSRKEGRETEISEACFSILVNKDIMLKNLQMVDRRFN
jgi:hypothetical protein